MRRTFIALRALLVWCVAGAQSISVSAGSVQGFAASPRPRVAELHSVTSGHPEAGQPLLQGASQSDGAAIPQQSAPAPGQQPAAPAGQQPGNAPQNPGAQQNPYSGYPTPGAPAGPVPLSDEPHHRLVLQNDFTRVYNVMVPPLDATLLHLHDLPYLYVVLGEADLINAVQGQPEVHLVLQDGEVRYSPGHFAHLVRTDSGVPFRNITIELVHPQGTARNLCKEVAPNLPEQCAKESAAAKKKDAAEWVDDAVPYFETDEVRVEGIHVSWGRDYVEQTPKNDALLVALSGANLDATLGGQHMRFLHDGDLLWMPAGVARKVVDFLGTQSNFLVVSFKDSAAHAAQ